MRPYSRQVSVHSLVATRMTHNHIDVKIHCCSGFYVRSLANDMGKLLGCGAHLIALRRTHVQDVSVSRAVTVTSVRRAAEMGKEKQLLLAVDALLNFPIVHVDTHQQTRLQHGQKVHYDGQVTSQKLRIYTSNGQLFAIGEVLPNGYLKTHKIFTA